MNTRDNRLPSEPLAPARGVLIAFVGALVAWGLFFVALADPRSAGVIVLALVTIVAGVTWPRWCRE